ncbi:HAD family hydrolase [bacterium]|nr:HAD family hydrolase [bacterium]
MIVAFDLDDTLYRELDYVESGFRAVACNIASSYAITERAAYDLLIESMTAHGRGRQFDDLLREVDAFTVRRRDALVQVYRQHTPEIELPEASREVLEALAGLGHRLFIVTDGNHHVQNRKVEALGVRAFVEHAYLTGRYGADATKPSTKVFELMLKRTAADASELVYVGDNPRKDFVGVRSLGGATIGVLTGGFRGETAAPGFDADLTVASIADVPAALDLISR